jgi:hypothetical protein
MEKIFVVLKDIEQENQATRESIAHFANQSNSNLFGMHSKNTSPTKGATNQLT